MYGVLSGALSGSMLHAPPGLTFDPECAGIQDLSWVRSEVRRL